LIKHYDPDVIEFIVANYIKKPDPKMLFRIAYWYSYNNHELDMRMVYDDFIHKIYDTIASENVLKTYT